MVRLLGGNFTAPRVVFDMGMDGWRNSDYLDSTKIPQLH